MRSRPKNAFAVFKRSLLISGISFASTLIATMARAEGPPPEGGGVPPFRCDAAGLLPAGLPRNVPAIPMIPSSLMKVADVAIDLVGTSGPIATTTRADDWDVWKSGAWLVFPSSMPDAGDYSFRFQESCARSDGGGYEERRHEVNLRFHFTEATPLPSVAGTLAFTQKLSGARTEVPVWTSGVCELRRFAAIDLVFELTPSAEIMPFQDVVKVRGMWATGEGIYMKGIGDRFEPDGLHRRYFVTVSCNPSRNSMFGFVDGSATFTLRSQLAGAPELPPLSADVHLDCPSSELVGPCDDAGSNPRDVSVDAPDLGASDAPLLDAARDRSLDNESDVASNDAPTVDGTPSDDPDDSHAGDASAPPSTADPHDGSQGCSVGSLPVNRTMPSGGFIFGFLLTAGAALRPRRAHRERFPADDAT
jgi:hypothetical protein